MRYGNWYLGLNFQSIVLKPGLSTVEIGDTDSQEESCAIELLMEKCSKRQGEFELEHSKKKKFAKDRMNK